MKRVVFLSFLLICCTSQFVNSRSKPPLLSMNVTVTPKPLFSQILHDQTYYFNVSLTKSENEASLLQTNNQSIYENNLIVVLIIRWVGRGSYDFGDATAGYTSNIDEVSYNTTIQYPQNNQTQYVLFNHTFERDNFILGIKPYETCEIVVNTGIYQTVNTLTQNLEEKKGEKLIGWSNKFFLLDETKIRYSLGKLKDLRDEIELLENITTTRMFDPKEYLGILEEMQFHIDEENYMIALDVWKDYEDKARLNEI